MSKFIYYFFSKLIVNLALKLSEYDTKHEIN